MSCQVNFFTKISDKAISLQKDENYRLGTAQK